MKVKIFQGNTTSVLENAINEWLITIPSITILHTNQNSPFDGINVITIFYEV